MVVRATLSPSSSTTQTVVSSREGGCAVDGRVRVPVHLHEEKVFVHLGAKEERDAKLWICDTGATNHMSSSRAAFADLDSAVCGTVHFGDDFVARIEGCGTMLFLCKNGEHQSFSDVYYIPRLTVNIVSIGQLDEAGYDVHIKQGAMMVCEPSG
jgi:hypothetical protein